MAAALSARDLRDLAREALAEADARGFVRFLPEGDDALLLTDAPRFCEDVAQREHLRAALASRGFDVCERDGLFALLPSIDLLLRLADDASLPAPRDWDASLDAALFLADRWLRAPETPFSPDARRLLLETARLLWRPRAQALAGLSSLRARAALMQRGGDRSGLRACGAMLANWCARKSPHSPSTQTRRTTT